MSREKDSWKSIRNLKLSAKDNTCVCCGEIIPEGCQYCSTCGLILDKYNEIQN